MSEIRHDWKLNEITKLYELPFNDLLYKAHQVHRAHFDPNAVQVSTLYSVKTGACPEDCAYCPQSIHYETGVEYQKEVDAESILAAAKIAQKNGATRFCVGAGWRSPRDSQVKRMAEVITEIKQMGLETCLTVGMLTEKQVDMLADADLDFYNHNLDTSPEYYEKIITTRTYQDRLDTLAKIRSSSIKVCCGGIIGMGEEQADRLKLLLQLANLPEHPSSVPINLLVKIQGTPLEHSEDVDPFDFIRLVALARIMMPQSFVRLSAGRNEMSEMMQALCFFAGANSIHYGEKLFVTPLPSTEKDQLMFQRLGIKPMPLTQAEHAS